jgi:hypothetical protein
VVFHAPGLPGASETTQEDAMLYRIEFTKPCHVDGTTYEPGTQADLDVKTAQECMQMQAAMYIDTVGDSAEDKPRRRAKPKTDKK